MFKGAEDRRKSIAAVAPHAKYKPATAATAEYYPMYMLPIAALLSMDKLRPHQEIKAQLRVYDHASMEGKVIFVSHQWLGWSEPDPNNAQLEALQSLLRRMMDGELGDVQMDWQQQLVMKDKTKVTAAELAAVLPDTFIWIDRCRRPWRTRPTRARI